MFIYEEYFMASNDDQNRVEQPMGLRYWLDLTTTTETLIQGPEKQEGFRMFKRTEDLGKNRLFKELAEKNRRWLQDESNDSQDLRNLKQKRKESIEYVRRLSQEVLTEPLSDEEAESKLMPPRPSVQAEEKKEEPLLGNEFQEEEVLALARQLVKDSIAEVSRRSREDDDLDEMKVEEPTREEVTSRKQKDINFGKKLFGYGAIATGSLMFLFGGLLLINLLDWQTEMGLESFSNFFEVDGLFYPKGAMIVLSFICGWATKFSLDNYAKIRIREKETELSHLENEIDHNNLRMRGGGLGFESTRSALDSAPQAYVGVGNVIELVEAHIDDTPLSHAPRPQPLEVDRLLSDPEKLFEEEKETFTHL